MKPVWLTVGQEHNSTEEQRQKLIDEVLEKMEFEPVVHEKTYSYAIGVAIDSFHIPAKGVGKSTAFAPYGFFAIKAKYNLGKECIFSFFDEGYRLVPVAIFELN